MAAFTFDTRTRRRYGLRLTRAGIVYIGLTLFLGFAAVNTGNNLLYLVVSALLGFMSLSGWLGQKNLQQLHLEWFPPEEVFAGTSFTACLVVKNKKKHWPSFLLDSLSEAHQTGLIAVLPRGGETTIYPQLKFANRGLQPLPPVEIRSTFPVNFFVRKLSVPTTSRVLVFPHPQACAWPTVETPTGTATHAVAAQPTSEGDFHGLRDYNGEPMRQIHWPQSARQQRLQVKQTASSGQDPLRIDLGRLSGHSLEVRLGQACWLIQHCLATNRPVGLTLGERTLPVGHGRPHARRLMTELARYDT